MDFSSIGKHPGSLSDRQLLLVDQFRWSSGQSNSTLPAGISGVKKEGAKSNYVKTEDIELRRKLHRRLTQAVLANTTLKIVHAA
jgi:hypothetical protein